MNPLLFPLVRCLGLSACAAALAVSAHDCARADDAVQVDTALVLAVDVSDSVDAERYRLQMEGIALALEDDGVINAITSGPRGAILLSLVSWADKAELQMPWTLVRNAEEARAVAGIIRALPQRTGEYTCVARMLTYVREFVIDTLPATASRRVIDVSGDGIDNCSRPDVSAQERDKLVAAGVAINALPILVKGENDVVGSGAYRAPGFVLDGQPIGPGVGETTIDAWYRDYVIGGPGAFVLTAQGFGDFGRSFRQKFVTEISANGG